MKGLKKVAGVALLATIISMGAIGARAGVTETPGGGIGGSSNSDVEAMDGTAESPGFFDLAIIFTATLIR
ncbi:MAG TPA: hypothetical protein VF544_19060 [Pyrinomonadaceae bacterium]|jgi:hypothetical protein